MTQNVSLPPAPKSSIQSEAPEMEFPHLAPFYVRQARNGGVTLVGPEDVYDSEGDVWRLPQNELYAPDEVGLHFAQVLRCTSDMTERSRLEEEQMTLEEDDRREKTCMLCEKLDYICKYCNQEDKTRTSEHLRIRAKLAEVDARLAAVLKLVKAALPAAKERRSPSVVPLLPAKGSHSTWGPMAVPLHKPLTAAPLEALPPLRKPIAACAAPAAAGGAGVAPLSARPAPMPDLWPVPYEDTIEALIDEILAR